MNWDYIAGFFDGEGNIHINKVKNAPVTFAILIRIYSSQVEILNEIKYFIGFGAIYQKKSNGIYELTFTKKNQVKEFLENIKDKLIIKKSQVNFLLENYNFNIGFSNSIFDIDKFRSFITRKNVENFRKLHTKQT